MKEIPLSQGKVALVDDEDWHRLSQKRWSAIRDDNMFYAARTIQVNRKSRMIRMHREVLGLQHRDGIMCDHWDRNGLNNQKHNLRICSNSQNQANSGKQKRPGHSIYKGVSFFSNWVHPAKPWTSTVICQKKRVNLGVFRTESNAARAYDEAARRMFGNYARINGVI